MVLQRGKLLGRLLFVSAGVLGCVLAARGTMADETKDQTRNVDVGATAITGEQPTKLPPGMVLDKDGKPYVLQGTSIWSLSFR
jgi:hypothetical protein